MLGCWGAQPDFIPLITEDAVDAGAPPLWHCAAWQLSKSRDSTALYTKRPAAAGIIDEIVPVSGEEAIKMSLALASQEDLFTGISGGATSALPLPPTARRPPLSSCGGCV